METNPLLNLPCKKNLEDLTDFHCDSCDKTLSDFRGKSAGEIKEAILSNPKETCGVFYGDQVGFKSNNFLLSTQRVGLSLLGMLGFIAPVITSCEEVPAPVADKNQNAFNNLKFPMKLEGTILDEDTKEPLSMATVSILQYERVIRQVKTDFNGNFSITIEKKDLLNENFDFLVDNVCYEQDTMRNYRLSQFPKGRKIALAIKAEPAPPVEEQIVVKGRKVKVNTMITMVCGMMMSDPEPEIKPLGFYDPFPGEKTVTECAPQPPSAIFKKS